ncbi:MAG: hypothetical protein AB4368_24320 [Xenococcaceae cyanobacterium]
MIDDAVTKYQDINLERQSLVDASGEKIGNISLLGENINISDASFILSQNRGNLVGGSIDLKANGSITFSGNSPDGEISSRIRSDVLKIGEGKGADLNISANQLILENIGTIQTATFSDSANSVGGDINIKTVDTVSLNDGVISASTFAGGNAGNINLSTSYLQITNAGSITSSTATSITSPSVATGNGGDIVINAEEIKLGESKVDARSTISSSSLSDGDTGNLLVNTKNLQVEGGAAFSASSFGNGNAGNITINAFGSITVSGTNNNFQGSSNPQTTIRAAVEAIDANAQRIFRLPEVPTGNAGNLTINTPALNISQEGVISVENQGTGSAGTLSINAETLNLDEAGRITAAASSGIGGNIELNAQDLNISNDSQITATATSDGDGGNITINTTNLTAKKNNQITASANPDRAYLTLFPGDVLRPSPDNYYSYPSQTDTDVVLEEPEYQEKLDRIVQRYLERLESEPEPEPEPERTSQADGVSPLGVSSSGLIWQPGDPMINATEIVETEDGEVFLVPPEEKQEFLEKLRCGSYLIKP